MAFEYTPYRNPYIGTIADLMARGEDAKAKALIDVASAQARAAEAKGQIYGNAISSIGNQIGNIPAQMQANREQAFKADQQARMVRGQQREDAAESLFNAFSSAPNTVGTRFVDAPSTPATLASRNMMLNDDGTMGLRDNPSTPATLASRQMVPTITNTSKRLDVNDVKGLDLWDIEAASRQFAEQGLGVQGQKYLELMRGSNSDMEKHHSSALAVARNDAARILRFTDSQIPSAVDQLVNKYTNNGVFPMQQLEMIKQQIAGIKQLPPQQQLLAYKKLVQAVGDVEPQIVTNTPGSVSRDITTDQVVGSGGPVAVAPSQSSSRNVRITLPDGKTKVITADYVPGKGKSGTYFVDDVDITSLNPQLVETSSNMSMVELALKVFGGDERKALEALQTPLLSTDSFGRPVYVPRLLATEITPKLAPESQSRVNALQKMLGSIDKILAMADDPAVWEDAKKGVGSFGRGYLKSTLSKTLGIGTKNQQMLRDFISGVRANSSFESGGKALTKTELDLIDAFTGNINIDPDVSIQMLRDRRGEYVDALSVYDVKPRSNNATPKTDGNDAFAAYLARQKAIPNAR